MRDLKRHRSVICLDRVVRVLLDGVQGRRDQLIEHPRVDVRAVGGDLDRNRASLQRPGEKSRAAARLRRMDSETSMTWPY
jgi:hypothetical protein